jgi:hypothetical protein
MVNKFLEELVAKESEEKHDIVTRLRARCSGHYPHAILPKIRPQTVRITRLHETRR